MTTTSALPLKYAADPRLSAEGRDILARITAGDLQPEFQAALDADPLLGGEYPNQPD
jgi:hypothetical protein